MISVHAAPLAIGFFPIKDPRWWGKRQRVEEATRKKESQSRLTAAQPHRSQSPESISSEKETGIPVKCEPLPKQETLIFPINLQQSRDAVENDPQPVEKRKKEPNSPTR